MSRDAALFPNYTADNFTSYVPAMSQAVLDYGFIAVHLKLAIGYATADATMLAAVPAAKRLMISRAYWQVTTSFAGGTSSAIGVSSDDADYATKGDILGGVGGDVAATLVSTGRVYKGGTLGTLFGSNGVIVVGSGKLIRFDRVASAFTSGAGFLHVDGWLID